MRPDISARGSDEIARIAAALENGDADFAVLGSNRQKKNESPRPSWRRPIPKGGDQTRGRDLRGASQAAQEARTR